MSPLWEIGETLLTEGARRPATLSDLLVAAANRARGCAGFLPVEAVAALADDGILVLDPFSTLVSQGVTLAAGVTLWPGTIIQATEGGEVTVDSGTRLFPGTRIVAAGARVTIGADTEIGEEGGFTIKADHLDGLIEIGSRVRLLGAGSLALDNHIGDGAQVLGAIRMQNCRLQAGGSHRDPDPDRRGASSRAAVSPAASPYRPEWSSRLSACSTKPLCALSPSFTQNRRAGISRSPPRYRSFLRST